MRLQRVIGFLVLCLFFAGARQAFAGEAPETAHARALAPFMQSVALDVGCFADVPCATVGLNVTREQIDNMALFIRSTGHSCDSVQHAHIVADRLFLMECNRAWVYAFNFADSTPNLKYFPVKR